MLKSSCIVYQLVSKSATLLFVRYNSVFVCQGHPKAKGLNNKPLPYLDDFYVIFGEDHALGVDAVQPSDAASKMQSAMSASNTDEGTERADSYTIPPELDHDAVMEDIINQGDLAVKRQHLYAELAKFTTLNVSERTRAMRHLNRDDGDAATFFQFPTEEEKLEFVWTILE
ncbi:hypothetical protein LINGRAPRIM_LOCUS3266 [Linum grandiflorum]